MYVILEDPRLPIRGIPAIQRRDSRCAYKPRPPSDRNDCPAVNCPEGRNVSIGRGLYTEVDVPGYNYKIDYSSISYQ